MKFARASGILLHPTSLPGPFHIGDLGPEAFAFVDFLSDARQSIWQVLPLGPTGYGDSPYACYSAFAGNTLLLSPEALTKSDLLTEKDLDAVRTKSTATVDFDKAHGVKDALLNQAHDNYLRSTDTALRVNFETFVQENTDWLDDYALFRALKNKHDGAPWFEWDPALASRKARALETAKEQLRSQIEAEKFYQFLFFQQWFALKNYANRHGVEIVGDIPIFVAHDSADVWTNPEQFKLNDDGTPTVVAGVPPDYFSATGQLWGNPLYNWQRMRDDGFEWWIARVRAALHIFDRVRIDHFRGFAACWEIPGGDKTAERGRWVEAPGLELFATIKRVLGDLPIIAEDLGVITPDVERLRDEFQFPGMRILQFGFGSDTGNVDLPHNYHANVVVYTGTHDNDTTAGWFGSVAGEGSTRTSEQIKTEREFCLRYLHTDGEKIHWDFVRTVLASVADTAIVPLQDVLGLGTEARMNLPNSTSGNWSWRLLKVALTSKHADRLRELTETYGRC